MPLNELKNKKRKNNYLALRKKHPQFVYRGFKINHKNNNLKIVFDFQIEPNINFRPEITVKNVDKLSLKKIGDRVLNNLVFHLGLMEIPSYWKATCSRKIIIEAGYLNKDQIKWWKDLMINGLGQFFYENKINWRSPNFFSIKCSDKTRGILVPFDQGLKNRYLVPVGGGKDSIVSLESLKKQKREINCFLVNPTKAAKKVVKIAGIKKPIVVQRKIAPTLLEMNQKGYLNGHTPFTAILSFLSVFCAVLFDYKNIAFSNEKSADEGNVKYLGKMVNHQYSKTSGFERKFKNYCKKYLAKNVNYFSYLRPYTELEISKMFIKYPQYFSAFSSCNLTQKTGQRWCGNCPKCLFVYAILYPFLNQKQLLKIFGEDLFKKKELFPLMKILIGQRGFKPFECVGTKEESQMAFFLSLKKAKKAGEISYLLQKFNDLK